MFLLATAEEIRGVADLCLHLLFAITVIIVGDERDNDAGFVAAGQFERTAAIIEFIFILPAHPISALAFGSLIPMRKSDRFFRSLDQLRREDNAAGVAGPMFGVERGIIFRQNRIAAVSKNAFDEIQIAHEIAGHKKTDFHRFFGGEPWNFRTDNRTEKQRDKTFRRLRLRGGERKAHDVTRRIERKCEHFPEYILRHGDLVVGNRQTAFGDMENSLRGPAVAFWVMQNTVCDAIGIDDLGTELVSVNWQRQHTRQPGAVERERARGQLCHRHVLQIIVEKCLNSTVGWAKVIAEQPVLFARLSGHRGDDFGKFLVVLNRHRRTANQRELDVDVRDKVRRKLSLRRIQ